jgi:amidase
VNLADESATQLARGIRDGSTTSVEVVEALLDRINRLGRNLCAIVTVDRERLIGEARAADRVLADGAKVGPFHGVPFTVKDSIDTAGVRTTSSYPPMATRVPTTDATVVLRLRAAGGILLGKTNLPELERDVQSWSPLFGRANNPWDLTRTPGGSTGGGAAAVASRLSPLELGSDTAGSIRIPAHYTGTIALKPTHRRVSTAGKMPPRLDRPRGMRHLSVIGAISRSVDDLATWLKVSEGLDGRDHDLSASPPVAPPTSTPLRIGWTPLIEDIPVETDTAQSIEQCALDLGATGVLMERVDVPVDWLSLLTLYGEIWGAECGLGLPRAVQRLAPFAGALSPSSAFVGKAIARGMRFNMAQYARALTRRDQFIAEMEEHLSAMDAWMIPTSSGPAFEHRRPGMLGQPDPIEVDGRRVDYDTATLGYTAPLSVLGSPVVAIPLRRAEGELPIGVQLVGRLWGDEALLEVARMAMRTLGPVRTPPGYQ